MKSFLEFVPCCGYPIQPTAPTTLPCTEESRSSSCGQRRRLNRSNSVSSSAAQWQPTLCAISEDNVVSVVVAKTEEVAKSGKKVPRKTSSKAEIRVHTSYGDSFARASVPLAIPAFSPTAFLF
ncbi:uncharacterized protein LOC122091273 [Macadamia integrifolia]|uniref:uncharacterized protein LOC122091273 n=1 Tax=Macadamia integrifolia TaxID=60698 RepID=UPI001C4EC670|nr:uncharacterized protein LOC122091273 [Macadamia integrifolia]